VKPSTVVRDLTWWVQDYAFAALWQLRGLAAGAPSRYLSGDLPPVVILPGVWESWTFMVPLIKPLHAAGHPVHVLASLHRNSKSVTLTAGTVAAYIAEHDLRDVVLVAHSKGGLIGKYAMTFLDDEKRIASMAAVCSPFSGSRYAPYLVLPSLRAFSPRDPTTVLLGANHRSNERIVSIYGKFDPHIPERSALIGATNVEIDLGGHFQILGAPLTRRVVLATGRGETIDPSLTVV
jgi:triacylglycerol lipase